VLKLVASESFWFGGSSVLTEDEDGSGQDRWSRTATEYWLWESSLVTGDSIATEASISKRNGFVRVLRPTQLWQSCACDFPSAHHSQVHVNAKLSLCFTHHDIKSYGRMELQVIPSVTRPGHFILGKRVPVSIGEGSGWTPEPIFGTAVNRTQFVRPVVQSLYWLGHPSSRLTPRGTIIPILQTLQISDHQKTTLWGLHKNSTFRGPTPRNLQVKVKVVPVLLTEHHTKKAYWGVAV